MSQTTDRHSRFASLFVDLTGTETITQSQRDADSRRVEAADERDVADYVADATQQSGLDDAIDDPETDN
ncbi:hypothetical protein LPA44_08000 [Halobacterium sp. KA-4]|jgi:hypothetical protein|uniref:hypothetical protein n=1 Tax=Halobacterium sp. KA-4 TaxID=2896367 RepID=UPI001E44C6E2|nr:hypothetical protein [Halobacterium sp. KA-4]MCD2199835.1 hypothetical protein [Halobacterium sp. KA-4]